MPKHLIAALNIDQGDALDLLEEIELTFDTKFADAEVADVETLGEFHRLLVNRVIGPETLAGKCGSQMAFYRIRRALRTDNPMLPISPDTALGPLVGDNPNAYFGRLARQSGLVMPRMNAGTATHFAALGFLASATLFATALFTQTFNTYWPLTLSMFAGSALSAMLDKGVLPQKLATVGDLARLVSALSHRRLRQLGARTTAEVIWQVLVASISDQTNVARERLGPHTRFFSEPKQKPAAPPS